MLRVAIAEDDPSYAKQLTDHLARFGKEQKMEIVTTVFANGIDLVEQYKPCYDLIFLDIEMPLMDGMSAAQRIRQLDSEVLLIFVTNLAQYAIQGYGVDALDYVLKPLTYPAFSMKLLKACRILEKRDTRALMLSEEGQTKRVPVSSITYIEVVDHQLIYHTTEGDFHAFGTLSSLEESLGDGFARCNHCYLVNLNFVEGVKEDYVVLGKSHLKISRPKKKAFLQKLSDHYRFGGR